MDSVYFDHRPFANFNECATGRSFFDDYRFGAGRDFVSAQLHGLRISVEGAGFEKAVSLEG